MCRRESSQSVVFGPGADPGCMKKGWVSDKCEVLN